MKSSMKNALALLASMALAVTLLTGCSQEKQEQKVVAKPAIKVGAILAETCGASFLGGPEARSIRMMVEQINAAGGVNGQQIELIIKDSAASPAKAISFAKQLIEEEHVIAILGPSTSGESMKLKSICEASETILISCGAAGVIIDPVAKWVFKTPQTDSFAAMHIFAEMNKMGIDKIAVLSGNTGFGKAGRGQLLKIAPDY
ncbi:MAG: ABC transporter substrate-binding protein, partial [Spirochaetales bacterium]|nr:ABC transporter substrate-binding protein [Spirochaetales bacterium]